MVGQAFATASFCLPLPFLYIQLKSVSLMPCSRAYSSAAVLRAASSAWENLQADDLVEDDHEIISSCERMDE